MFFYLCSGNNPMCNKRSCYKNGGECRHTTNRAYAKYGDKVLPVKKIGDGIFQTEKLEKERKHAKELSILRPYS